MNKELIDAMSDNLKKALENSKIRISADIVFERTINMLSLYEKAIDEIKEIIMDPDNIHLIDEIVEKLERDIWFERSNAREI
jgi:lipopolysaccharide biosynthesis regulator YciM